MRRVSINIHIAIAVLVAMLGILVSLVLLGANENRVQGIFDRQAAGTQRLLALHRYEHRANTLASSLQSGGASQDASRSQRFEKHLRELEQGASDLQALFHDSPVVQQRLDGIHRQVRHWVGEIAAASGTPGGPPNGTDAQARWDALKATLSGLEQGFREIEQHAVLPQAGALVGAIEGFRGTASGVGAISIMSVLIIWWWSLGVIRRGLGTMEGALTDVARGKTSATLDPGQLPQEFGQVIKAYHDVCQHLVDRSSIHARDMEKLNEQLLKGLITICSSCKKIKTERGHWVPIEAYVRSRTTADFTHALCQECLNKTLDNL